MESERENSAGAKLVITVSMVVENRIHYFLCPHVLTRTDTHITTQLGTEIHGKQFSVKRGYSAVNRVPQLPHRLIALIGVV